MKRRNFVKAAAGILPAVTSNAKGKSSKSVGAVVIGQSNEQGAGKTKDLETAFKTQVKDPIGPNGGVRSWWPYCAETLLERSDINLQIRNCAVGATSLCDSWTGRIRVWSRYMLVTNGSYVIHGSDLFRAYYPIGSVGQSLTPPTESLKAGNQYGGLSWENLGSAKTPPGVCSNIADPLFDPNNYLKTAKTELLQINNVDEHWVFLSFGQGDKTLQSTSLQFQKSIQATVDFFSDTKAILYIGFTCAGADPSIDLWYQNELLPGWRNALQALANNNFVRQGANLRNSLGKLTSQISDETPGLLPDGLHLNNAGYKAAGKIWAMTILTQK